jgi:hypothetical protein
VLADAVFAGVNERPIFAAALQRDLDDPLFDVSVFPKSSADGQSDVLPGARLSGDTATASSLDD